MSALDLDIANEIPVLAFTGGPCGGKTTGLCYIGEKLADFGYHVITVPEVPTMLINAGFPPNKSDFLSTEAFQTAVIRLMRELEAVAIQTAQQIRAEKIVIICDRGVMDARPYMPDGMFERILGTLGLSIADVLGRYKCVCHLVTTADGAEEFYTLENNFARFETPEEARQRDKETQEAWVGCNHLEVIKNPPRGGFTKKLNVLLQIVCHTLGIPVPLEIEKKYLIKPLDTRLLKKEGIHSQTVGIEQYYIVSSDSSVEIRFRRRSHNGSDIFFRTEKTRMNGEVLEIERMIPEAVYYHNLSLIRSDTKVIRKKRICFLYDGQYFECDAFEPNNSPHAMTGKDLLEIELTDKNKTVVIPSFIKVIREVTNDPHYTNYALAQN